MFRASFRLAPVATLAALLLLATVPAAAQSEKEIAEWRARADELWKNNRMVDAVPFLEKIAAAAPGDVGNLDHLAFALLASAATVSDEKEQKTLRMRARELALKVKELAKGRPGLYEVVLETPPDGSKPAFSANQATEAVMREAEDAFVRGDFEKALASYARVLELDPRHYHAALFSGDVRFKQKEYAQAAEWFARAVAIEPRAETAYRYWGDSLLMEGKTDEARQKFFDAILAEPYSNRAWSGLMNWSRRTGVRLSHPRIESPNSTTTGDKGQVNITIDSSTLGAKDGREKWMLYEISRAAWKTEGFFQKKYPEEKEYRHSLQEEAGALSLVADMVAEGMKNKEIKELHPSLTVLLTLHRAGPIEAYVLFARPNAGIARDYEAYHAQNRAKLRQYLEEYVAPQRRQ
jgi:tetratricopeptide (TPR) repeat protein